MTNDIERQCDADMMGLREWTDEELFAHRHHYYRDKRDGVPRRVYELSYPIKYGFSADVSFDGRVGEVSPWSLLRYFEWAETIDGPWWPCGSKAEDVA